MGIGQQQMREVTTVKGKRQWELQLGYDNTFMMIPADVALWWDDSYRREVTRCVLTLCIVEENFWLYRAKD